MSTAPSAISVIDPPDLDCSIEIVVPVFNEEGEVAASVRRLRRYLDTSFPFPAIVTIADNASTDRTWSIAKDLVATLGGVHAIRLECKGRGRALRAAWEASEAAIVAYMDVDLSTDLDALLPLVAPLVSGHSDVAIGSRLARGANVVRGPKRELISRSYNLLVRTALHNGFTDAQCGFKALRSEVARDLLPFIEDDAWFFDTELLVQAERAGLRVHEVPVDWVDNTDSRVDLFRTAVDDFKGVCRLARQRPDCAPSSRTRRQTDAGWLRRFASVGIVSTLAYLALYLLLRASFGEYLANAAALVVCTIGNTIAHSRFTFGERDAVGWRMAVVGTATVLATSLALTTGALVAVNALVPASAIAEASALAVASAVAALCRFVLLRAWIFRAHVRAVTTDPAALRADQR
ncbi:MAG TPA: glycosyltransferase [Acidimicrobiales bacterium]|nr:glycosyltransferase [Acidimicrobiales bacterium]